MRLSKVSNISTHGRGCGVGLVMELQKAAIWLRKNLKLFFITCPLGGYQRSNEYYAAYCFVPITLTKANLSCFIYIYNL